MRFTIPINSINLFNIYRCVSIFELIMINFNRSLSFSLLCFSDFQKLEREARICRKLQHPNIGEYSSFLIPWGVIWVVKRNNTISLRESKLDKITSWNISFFYISFPVSNLTCKHFSTIRIKEFSFIIYIITPSEYLIYADSIYFG